MDIERNQTWPSERKPATSMTEVNSGGSNSGLLTPTFASANPTPTKFVIVHKSASFCMNKIKLITKKKMKTKKLD